MTKKLCREGSFIARGAHSGHTQAIIISDWLSPNPPDIADPLAATKAPKMNSNADLSFENLQELRNTIIRFNNDEDVRSLGKYYSKKSFAEIAKISRKELYHNNFLGWLFDVKESHGLSILAIEKLLELLVSIDKDSDLTRESELYDNLIVGDFDLDNVVTSTEKNINNVGRIDIFIEAQLIINQKRKNLKIVIENKVGSKEHSDQTIKYYDAIELSRNDDSIFLYVYLTPMSSIDLFDLNHPESASRHYLQINYQLLVDRVLEPILDGEIPMRTKSTIEEYVLSLSQPTLDPDDEEYKQGLIMALGKEEQLLLTKFWNKNKKLILAALYAIGSDPSQDKETRDNATTALSSLSTSNKDRSKYIVALKEYNSDIIKKSDIGLCTVRALEANNMIDEQTFRLLRNDKSCNFFLLKTQDEVTDNEAKYGRYRVSSDPEIYIDNVGYYVARNWGVTSVPKIIKKMKKKFPGLDYTKITS